jgi:glycosyltransferase involved in cell wall biosynthesis
MKVLHVINTLSAGGAELHLLTLCRYLKRAEIEVVVACLKEHVKESRSLRPDFEQEGITVVNLGADRRFDPRCLVRLVRLLRQECPDLLHTHLPRADFVGAFSHFFYSSVPWICSIHGLYSRHWSGKRALPLFSLLWRHADAMIAISHAVKTWVVNEWSVPSEKVTVIHYGIETERFAQSHVDLRHAWGLNGRAVVGAVGSLRPVKGHDLLIKGLRRVSEQIPHASLLIAGHDLWGYGKTLQALIDKFHLNEQVRIVGFQSDVSSFLHALDVFALPSRSEGFGQVAIEAMAAGKPVVASKIAPLTEIVIDGQTGILAEPDDPEAFADAITWLLMHPEEAQRMGRRGQERVQDHFLAESMVIETMSLYETVLSQRIRREGTDGKRKAICRH